jgi:peptidoglycan/xylan/chitin deacetylase (PgdA/CDA1 family)
LPGVRKPYNPILSEVILFRNRGSNEIAITFDDGPDAQVTTMILDILKENNVKAAFYYWQGRFAS